MTKVEKFTIFIIEEYRYSHGLTAKIVYNLFKDHNIFDYINETYEALHTLDPKVVISDIDQLINSKGV